MLPAPLPDDETERLTELRSLAILDTQPEERFNAIVRLAQQLFEVPIAYIALIDSDRQWFKAKCGLTVDETGREISFCGHAILESELLLIPDARLDWRFADNPLVTGEPYVRFYAGHPLAGPNGYNVGTLCLADRVPRTLSPEDREIFATLARMTEEQLQLVELVAAQRQLLDAKTQLLETQQRLAAELKDAEDYLRALLPPRLTGGDVRTDWTYVSSSQVGGDLFGYHWLDDRCFVLYLLDVCGHGVGASLLASSVHTTLRNQSLPYCDFTRPGEVLAALDVAFPMDEHHNKFFTIWYGVYDRVTRELSYSAAGHHPAVLLTDRRSLPEFLGPRALMIGVQTGRATESETRQLFPGARLYVFSDGAFEIRRPDGAMLGMSGLQMILQAASDVPQDRTANIYARLTEWTAGEPFPDDFTMLELEFE